MKVVVTLKKGNKRFLVDVQRNALFEELLFLVRKKQYAKAASVVLAKGDVERELTKDEVNKVGASLLLEGGSK